MRYEDTTSGVTTEFLYNVTQAESEGPEHMLYKTVESPNDEFPTHAEWQRWPDHLPLPEAVVEHFFGSSSKTTHVMPRASWYREGDNIVMIADEGNAHTESNLHRRHAQHKVIEIELANAAMMFRGKTHDGDHEWTPGPYLWTVHILSPDDVAKWTNDESDVISTDQLVIATAGGGDSSGFGYSWVYDSKHGFVFMTEDPKTKYDVS